jgi:hypothetical protein
MGRRIFAFLVSLLFPFLTLNVFAVEDNPAACDCHTVDITKEEITGGCTETVKEQTCTLYRETRIWKERLKRDQEQRELEKRMEPRYAPR